MTLAHSTDSDRRDEIPGIRLERLVWQLPRLSRTYEGVELESGMAVLVTTADPDVRLSPDYVRRLRGLGRAAREEEAAGGFARVLRVASTGGRPFFVVRRPAGVRLSDSIAGASPLGARQAVDMLQGVAAGLARLHQAGIVAGDVHPRQVFVDSGGTSVLAAFGWANVGSLRGRQQQVPADLLDYAALEQLRGQPTAPRTDVFALAALFMTVITGETPFGSRERHGRELSLTDALRARRSQPISAVVGRRTDVSPSLRDILERGLSSVAAVRPASPRALLAEIERALEDGQADGDAERSGAHPRRFERSGSPGLGAAGGVGPRAKPRPQRGASSGRRAAGSQPPAAASPASRRRGSAPGDAGSSRAATTGGSDRRSNHATAGLEDGARPQERDVAASTARPASATAGPADRGRRIRSGELWGLAAVAVACAAIGTAVASRLDRPAVAPVSATVPSDTAPTATRGALRVQYPATWESSPPQSLPRVPLRQAMMFQPREYGATDPGQARVFVGMVEGTDTDLLSPGLLPAAGPRRTPPEAVRLGRHVGLRYTNVSQPSAVAWGQDRPWTIYAIPTTAGTATVICELPRQNPLLADACEGMASTLTLTRGRSLDPGPDPTYARSVSAVTRDLDVRRRLGRDRLRAARSDRGQARVLGDLARAYTVAGRQLERTPERPGTAVLKRDLLRAARAARGAYERMAAAAARRDSDAYGAASRSVSERETRLRQALDRMRAWAGGAPAARPPGS